MAAKALSNVYLEAMEETKCESKEFAETWCLKTECEKMELHEKLLEGSRESNTQDHHHK